MVLCHNSLLVVRVYPCKTEHLLWTVPCVIVSDYVVIVIPSTCGKCKRVDKSLCGSMEQVDVEQVDVEQVDVEQVTESVCM